jgi:hypothetical protein
MGDVQARKGREEIGRIDKGVVHRLTIQCVTQRRGRYIMTSDRRH